MKATVLIDNLSEGELIKEWGLCIFIEYEGKKILLDTGGSGAFADNAKRLGIHLDEVDCGVLSHAHYDHSNGMDTFFKENTTASFYLRQGSEENCYSQHFPFKKYIGLRKGTLKKYADRICFAVGDFEVFPGVYLIPHKCPGMEEKGKKAGMYRKVQRKYYPDDFSHEQSLVFRTEQGLVIFNSCSHGGADNIIREVSDTFQGEHICALIGGFHLFLSSAQDIKALAGGIRDTRIDRIYTGHCTGQRAFHLLEQELPGMVTLLYTGMVLEF